MKRLETTGLILAAICAIWAVIGGIAGNGTLTFIALGAGVAGLVVLIFTAVIPSPPPPRRETEFRDTDDEIPAWVHSPSGLTRSLPGRREETAEETERREQEKEWPNGRF